MADENIVIIVLITTLGKGARGARLLEIISYLKIS